MSYLEGTGSLSGSLDLVKAPDVLSKEFEELIGAIAADFQKRNASEEREHPFEAIRLVKEYRLGAIQLPENEGGTGASFVDLFKTIIRVAEADPDVAHILRSHFLFVESLLQAPDTALKERMLLEVRQGALFGNAYTENSKHAAGGGIYNTRLTRDGNRYVLNGEKYFSTGTYYSDYTVVLAMLGETPRQVIVPVTRKGVSMLDDWDGFGQKFTGSGTTRFENVSVDESEIFVTSGETEKYQALPQLYLQGIVAGILRNIVTDSVELIGKRKRAFFHSNSDDLKQDVQLQEVVGRLSSYAFAAESIVLAAAKSIDDVSLAGTDSLIARHSSSLKAAQAKIAIEDFAHKAATLLFEAGGASATRQSANLDRHWRNIRTLSSHNPTLYKARAIGNYHINQVLLPENVYF
ncbi:crotonobetainyl-CoA dehydrogenase [Bhargavaea cecembensis DSE10]|uniref:Dibenzothiophene monooxygenase n=1 Tax=Bhargavaea cecembensis DSE10 TaxID=1235279 RepID=M7NJJ1_9BACL|nr:acyl-CoA dehydrogenase family protein [Bhargavaea cecembensis]EMR07296.1 crotonobetainyl-CoA dehydrogenase [Bhargavaea cecembensis DSE10]